jgi:hypothetical protein
MFEVAGVMILFLVTFVTLILWASGGSPAGHTD